MKPSFYALVHTDLFLQPPANDPSIALFQLFSGDIARFRCILPKYFYIRTANLRHFIRLIQRPVGPHNYLI